MRLASRTALAGVAVLPLWNAVSHRARRELVVALQRIAEDNADAAEQLNDAVHEAARLIGANPAVGARRPRSASAATASGRSRASAISWPTPRPGDRSPYQAAWLR